MDRWYYQYIPVYTIATLLAAGMWSEKLFIENWLGCVVMCGFYRKVTLIDVGTQSGSLSDSTCSAQRVHMHFRGFTVIWKQCQTDDLCEMASDALLPSC